MVIILGMFSKHILYSQITFTSIPDSLAMVNEIYTYDVNVIANPSDTSFALDFAPAGMSINLDAGKQIELTLDPIWYRCWQQSYSQSDQHGIYQNTNI